MKQGPEEIKEFSKNTIHANTHSRPTASFCAGQEIINKTKHISEVLRIHPVAPRKSDTQNRNLFTLNYHPFRCIVSMSTFKSIKRQCTCVFKQETNKLIMKITTIPSPRQKDERRKIKARNTDNSSVAEKENCKNLLNFLKFLLKLFAKLGINVDTVISVSKNFKRDKDVQSEIIKR